MTKTAAEVLAETVNQQLTENPYGVILLTGDFNTCKLESHLPDFEQYVTCYTREDKTLDKCFGNIKGAYKSFPLPNLGKSDHIMINLLPTYKPKLKRFPVKKKLY